MLEVALDELEYLLPQIFLDLLEVDLILVVVFTHFIFIIITQICVIYISPISDPRIIIITSKYVGTLRGHVAEQLIPTIVLVPK